MDVPYISSPRIEANGTARLRGVDYSLVTGLGPAAASRVDVPDAAPERAPKIRFLRAVQARPSPRDQALVLLPFYAGAVIAEVATVDVDDVRLSARKGIVRIYGKGERAREILSTPSSAAPPPTGSADPA